MCPASDDSGEDALLGLPETGLAIIPGYVLNLIFMFSVSYLELWILCILFDGKGVQPLSFSLSVHGHTHIC